TRFPIAAIPEALSPMLKNPGADSRVSFLDRQSPPPSAVRPYSLDACLDTLLNHRPLELGKDPDDPEERLAGRRGGVDAMLVNEEVNFLRVDLGEEIDQVGE